jgi:hypothetical protein
VPIASANVTVSIEIQSRRIAVFVPRFQPAPVVIYFGDFVRVAIRISPALQLTTVISAVVSCECVFWQRQEAAEYNQNNQDESLFLHIQFSYALFREQGQCHRGRCC